MTTKARINRSGPARHVGRHSESISSASQQSADVSGSYEAEQLLCRTRGHHDSDLQRAAEPSTRERATEPTNRVPSTTPELGAGVPASSSVPRISRLLALALKMEQMIEDGTIAKYTDLAHVGQVSAARITQIMNLLHLAPDIQEQILSPDAQKIRLRESAVRKLSTVVLWSEQRVGWRDLLAAASQESYTSRPS
jgi:hypothetical protein